MYFIHLKIQYRMKIFLKSILAVAVILGIILGYVREVPYFSNTFEIRFLFFRCALFGILMGILIGWLLSKNAEDKSDRLPIMMFSIVGGLAVFPLLGISTNHLLAKNDPLSIKIIFKKEEPLRTSRFGIAKNTTLTVDAFYLYFIKEGEAERIRTKTQSFRNVEPGQEIELPIKHGFWGFTFVDVR